MSMEGRKPVHFLKVNPEGWKRASLPRFMASAKEVMSQLPLSKEPLEDMVWSQRHDYLDAYAVKMQERRWEAEVGLKVENTHFTVVIPVYNEENSLPSFLSTLMFWDIPSSVDMQVIFVTNACSDASNRIIDAFLSDRGKLEVKKINYVFKDKYVEENYKIVQQDSKRFIHVNTPTSGKANALGIGNVIACQSKHGLAICVDANSFLEPDAIRILFAHAYRAFQRELNVSDTVLISGKGQIARKASRFKELIDRTEAVKQHLIEDSGVVLGCLMAWNTLWMESIGGPPEVALEDYAMGVMARVKNYKIEQVNARVWNYRVTNLKGFLGTRARYTRGMLQILDFTHYDPDVVKVIEKKAYFIKNFPGRLRYLLYKSKQHPRNFPRYMMTFLLWEYALQKGKKDYAQNPTNQSWEKIDATY